MSRGTNLRTVNDLGFAVIKTKNLAKRYGDMWAVADLSLEIQRGETLGLLGPNGAGKSTTISMIVGLLSPDKGDVWIGSDGISSAGPPTDPFVRSRIGISPQSLSLYEELTAKENLNFFGSLYDLSGSKLKERTNWSLHFAGLDDRKNDRVKSFSGGMKRRLNIAAALMHQPEILLLDEPTVGVDPQSRNHIFESIESLKETGLTVIYTTHYMEEAQRLCDRVAIIDHGKLLAIDTVDRLIEQHGGQSSITAEVKNAERLNGISSESIQHLSIDNHQIKFSSDRPFEAIAELTSNHGVQIETLQLNRADLESVFLNLTGRSLRD